MRPETLPPSYYKFIVRTGPIHEVVLQSVRDNCRGKPINLPAVLDYCAKHNGGAPAPLDTLYPSIIPCSVLHPDNVSCFKADLKVFIQSAKRIFPLYATLTFLPVIAFSLNKLVRSPVSVITQGLLSTVRSVAFLASFVSLYQVVICLHRKLIPKDHKFVYFFAGIISSLSILIEKKSRRSELALYTMPRGLDSLYMLLCDRKWLAGFPNGEVLIFSLSIGGLMYFFHNEPEAMSPIFHWVIKTLFRKRLL